MFNNYHRHRTHLRHRVSGIDITIDCLSVLKIKNDLSLVFFCRVGNIIPYYKEFHADMMMMINGVMRFSDW